VGVDEEGVMAAALGAERLGLPHNPPAAVARTRDKAAMRRALAQASVPQPRFALLPCGADVAAVAREVGLPCVVKPLGLWGSRGVIRADDGEQARAAAERIRGILAAASEPADGPLLVESHLPRGYHPILATRAETGEVLHIRARKGSANTSRGALRFVEELIPRLARAGAGGQKLLRADSGFENKKVTARLQQAGWTYSIGARQHKHIKAAITEIPEQDWTSLVDYPDSGEAQIAQTMLGHQRLIVRRTRLVGAQAELWRDWRHHAFLTNRTDPLEVVESEHRQHAVVELAIRDLKDQALAHFPSGKFLANAAWTVIALAHNLLRWTSRIGLPNTIIPTARTIRRRLLTVPGRITRTGRQVTLRMPARWPWQTTFLTALEQLRALSALT